MRNTYFKKLCPKHPEFGGERWRLNRVCVGCGKERADKYRKANKEKFKEWWKEWYAVNKEKRSNYCKEWQSRNKEYVSDAYRVYRLKNIVKKTKYLIAWRKKNPDKVCATANTHQVIRKRLIGSQALANKYAKETAKFYLLRPAGHEVDHIVPLRGKTVSGLHVPWNLQYLPISENRRKHNKWK